LLSYIIFYPYMKCIISIDIYFKSATNGVKVSKQVKLDSIVFFKNGRDEKDKFFIRERKK
jgi:hypothetical protein